jgi:hypothetical protein
MSRLTQRGLRSQPQRFVRLRQGARINDRLAAFLVPSLPRDLLTGKSWSFPKGGNVALAENGYGFDGATTNSIGVDFGGYPITTSKDWTLLCRVYFPGTGNGVILFADADAAGSNGSNVINVNTAGSIVNSQSNATTFSGVSGTLPTLSVGWHDIGLGALYVTATTYYPFLLIDGKRYLGVLQTSANFAGPSPRLQTFGAFGVSGMVGSKISFAAWWQRAITESDAAQMLANPYSGLAANGPYYDEIGYATAAALGANLQAKSTLSSTLGSWPIGSWVQVAVEGGSYTANPNTLVRYGAAAGWVERVMSGTFTFDNTTFGDPASGSAKVGQIWASAAQTAFTGNLLGKATMTGTLSSPAVALGTALSGRATMGGTLSGGQVALGTALLGKATMTGVLSSPQIAFSGSLPGKATMSGTLATSSTALAGTLAGKATMAGTLNYGGTTNRRRMFLGF